MAADLTPEVLHALVRIMSGEVELESLTDDELIVLAKMTDPEAAKATHAHALRIVHDRGATFEAIADRIGVHVTTVLRRANASPTDRRRGPRPSGK